MGLKSLDGIFVKSSSKYYRRRVFYQLQHFKAVNFWHLYIQKYQVGLVLLDSFQALKAIITFLYYFNFIFKTLQIFKYNHSSQRLVINNQYTFHTCGILIIVVNILSFA